MSDFWKLTPIIAVTTVVALLVASVLLGVYSERAYQAEKIDEVTAQARILASTVTAALTFNDRAAAQEYVNALGANPEVQAAGVYDANGALFAGYVRSTAKPPPARVSGAEARFLADRLSVVTAVAQGDSALGFVAIRTVTEPLVRRLVRYGAIALLVLMAALVVAVLTAAQRALARANAELILRARELATANRSLQAEMAERERAEEQLRQAQKMEAIGQLTSGIAHDFNNLLTGVLGHVELAMARSPDEAVQRSLRSATRAAERGAKLTQQLLAFARRQHLQARPVDLNGLVRGMEDMLMRAIGPLVQIELALATEPWPALVDASQLEVAILNLAINARDAMPEGGRLTVETANLPPGAPLRPAELPAGEDFVMVAVADTGSGMDEATLARAFEPFFTTKDIGKGTGLGLSQVYGLAKQSGGSARIESEPGRGTVVRLFLPRAASAASGRGAEPAVVGHAVPAARILLVDDDADVREVTAAMLRGEGHEVVEAAGGRAAIALLAAGESFDLLLADYAMPSMNGDELAREVRRQRPGLPILLITGFAGAGSLAGTADLYRVLRKPFRKTELAGAVAAAVQRG
jgi:signal transduction histidine kinase